MISGPPRSTPGVASVQRLDGKSADPNAIPLLLVEVPHGADTQAHYDALFARLHGSFPDRLERFFQVNTDVGAWSLGLRTAELWIVAHPGQSALLVRCEIPRTFIDVNRIIDQEVPDGMTPGLPPYVRDPRDIRLLRSLHGEYTRIARRAYIWICEAGGRAVIPHTYAPRSVPIQAIEDDIVEKLTEVYQPDQIEKAPLRAEVDLITATPEGLELAPEGLPEALTEALIALGLTPHRGGTYSLHPSTTGAHWSKAYPGQVLCFEVRRDLITHWEPFVPKTERPEVIDRIAGALVGALSVP